MLTLHCSPKLGSVPRYSKGSQVFGPESKGWDTSLQSRYGRDVWAPNDCSIGEILKTSPEEAGSYAESKTYLKECLTLAEWNGFNMIAWSLEMAEKWRQRFFFFGDSILFLIFLSQDAEEVWEWDSCCWTLGDLSLVCVSSDVNVWLSQKGTGKKWELVMCILNGREDWHLRKKSYFYEGNLLCVP